MLGLAVGSSTYELARPLRERRKERERRNKKEEGKKERRKKRTSLADNILLVKARDLCMDRCSSALLRELRRCRTVFK